MVFFGTSSCSKTCCPTACPVLLRALAGDVGACAARTGDLIAEAPRSFDLGLAFGGAAAAWSASFCLGAGRPLILRRGGPSPMRLYFAPRPT